MTLTPEQLAKSREDFELEIKQLDGFCDSTLDCDENGEYKSIAVKAMLAGWLARHQTLVVDLPKRGCGYYTDGMVDLDDVIESVQSAGINYREKE